MSGDLAFESEGLVAAIGDRDSDATRLTQIRWDPGVGCERLTIGFDTDSGAPATTLGLTGVTAFPVAGYVRITLPEEIARTAVADLRTDGALVDRIYVVRDETGSLHIDVLGTGGVPLASRAFTTTSPASLVLDLTAAEDAPVPVGLATSDSAVIVSPLPGPALYPFTVEAYGQPSLRSIRLQLSRNDITSVDRAIALDGAPDAWQAFSARIDDGSSGASILFVGVVDPNDRPLEGATVSVDLP